MRLEDARTAPRSGGLSAGPARPFAAQVWELYRTALAGSVAAGFLAVAPPLWSPPATVLASLWPRGLSDRPEGR